MNIAIILAGGTGTRLGADIPKQYIQVNDKMILTYVLSTCVQAPEVFRFTPYYEACKALLPDDIYTINGSSEPAILAGMKIAMIPGDEKNYKITTQGDLERFREDRKY